MRVRSTIALFAPDDGGAGGAAAAAPAAAAAAPAAAAPPAPVAFAETLPEDIRGEAAFRDIKDLGSLAKSYLHAQRMVGDPAQFVKLPSGPDDTAGWDGVFSKLGRPEAPDKYALKAGEGVTVDPAFQQQYQAWAHKAGLTQAQAQTLMTEWNTHAGAILRQQTDARTAATDAGTAALKQEWGAAYDQRVALAKRAVDHFGGAPLLAELDALGLGNAPQIMRAFANAGLTLQEDGLVGRGGSGAGAALSPAEARQQINALQADPAYKAAALDRRHPQHADMVARMTRLHEFATARAA